MTSVDVKWPSEDEEFDTKNGEAAGHTATAEAEPVEHKQSSAAETSPEDKAPEEETAPAAEQEHPEPEAAPAVAPAAAAPVAAAPVAAKAGGSRGGNILRLLLEAILVIAVVALAMWGYSLQSKNKNLQKQVDTLNSNPAIVEQRKTNELVSKVGALIELPTGEQPQAALVSDANSLKKQYPFFTSAQNGDEILFYFKAGKVIVYRPSTNKIVQTGPLTVSQGSTAPTTGTTSTTTTKR